MKQNAFTTFLSNVGNECKKNSPALLICAGLVSMGATVIMVAKAAPKAEDRLIKSRRERYFIAEEGEELNMTRKEKLLDIWEDTKAVAPIYAPAAVTFAVGTACILGSYKISTARLSALTTAYGIAENKLVEYQKKVIETIGEEKEQEIREKIVEDHMKEEEEKGGVPELTEDLIDGTQLWFDDVSKRYFRATLQELYDAKEHVNVTLQSSPVSLNEFYCVLGIDEVEALDIYEWPEGSKLEFRFETHRLKDGITTCNAVCYDVPVGRDYYCVRY